MAKREQALLGMTVLDLTHHIAGPYCTKMLADFGAEVIKIERPGSGDPARSMGPFPKDEPHNEKSGLFLYLNTNKKSITLNLKSATGAGIFKNMVEKADAVVENFSPRVMPGLGLDYKTLKEINPDLVMTSIASFGQTGPYRDYKAADLNIWGLSGIQYELGEPDRPPLRIGNNVSEYVAGLYGALSTLSAVYYRYETGVGQHVDISILEAFHTMQPSMTVVYSYAGFIRKRAGIRFPWGILPCKDGYVGFYLPTQVHWESLCALMEMPELREKPEYETPMSREERREEIAAIIVSWLKDKLMDDVFHAAQELRLPLTIVPNPEQLTTTAQHKARKYFTKINHPAAGRLTYPGAPFKMTGTPWQAGRAPLLGEHNDEIYCERLGYSKDDLVKLREEGVI
ncbi:MAG TPA: CoA transferase [Dehalococcoidia bacterium]|nr:CoA transferase [Dehalococcoidia bacterium]